MKLDPRATARQVLEERLATIETWEDFYTYLDTRVRMAQESWHPFVVIENMFTMYAFLQAMRDLPEEGDIKKLIERMIVLLTDEAGARLGVEMSVFTSDGSEVEATEAPDTIDAALDRAVVGNKTLH